jgi:hypothetical protein
MGGDIAPVIVMVTGILTAGGVLILRPISKHLAEFLRIRALKEQRIEAGGADLAQLRDALANAESRLALLEERQNFTESLLTTRREPAALPPLERRPGIQV